MGKGSLQIVYFTLVSCVFESVSNWNLCVFFGRTEIIQTLDFWSVKLPEIVGLMQLQTHVHHNGKGAYIVY